MVQWDSPLFTVPWSDEDIPGDDIWKALTEGIVKPPNAGTAAVCSFLHLASRALPDESVIGGKSTNRRAAYP